MNSVPFYFGFPIANAIQTNNGSLASFQIVLAKKDDKQFGVVPGTNVLVSLVTPADLFVSKLAPDGSALIYSTYLGGEVNDFGTGIGVAPDGTVSVSGWTESTNF